MIKITHSIRQLSLVLAGFVAVSLLLESDGLAHWADRLEPGPLRTVAIPATQAIQKTLAPLGVGAMRDGALKNLARVGWSDDEALLAEVANEAKRPRGAANPACTTASAAAAGNTGMGVAGALSAGAANVPSGAGSVLTHATGSDALLANEVPKTMLLPPLPPVEPGKLRVVALAGDSMMAVGLSATFMRQAAGDKNLRIVKAFKSGTGLARPEVYNWADEYPALLATDKPDVVIVAIGANDGQGFVVDHKVLAYGTDAWRRVYQDRLASYLAMVSAGGARVVWVALPPMRVPVYDEKIAAINRIAYTVVSQSPQATWWNPVSLVGDEQGKFREFETEANGQAMRVRSTDGIHLSDEGAGKLTTLLIRWLDPPPPASQPANAAGTGLATVPQETSQANIGRKHRPHRAAKGHPAKA
jgi:lysophospholipase L1-like esterase